MNHFSKINLPKSTKQTENLFSKKILGATHLHFTEFNSFFSDRSFEEI